VAAVLLGLFLLNEYDTTPFSADVETTDTTETTRRSPTVTVLPPASTRAVRPPEEVKVLPANGTNTSGLGGRTGEFLRTAGYNALAPIDATRTFDATQVQHKPEFEAEARAPAQLLQLPASSVRPMEESPPVPDTRSADIIVLAGADLRLPGEGAATTSTTRRL
jgi:hypothetical protein